MSYPGLSYRTHDRSFEYLAIEMSLELTDGHSGASPRSRGARHSTASSKMQLPEQHQLSQASEFQLG